MNSGFRSIAKNVISGTRSFHSTGVKKMGGGGHGDGHGHGHGHGHDEPYYIHSKHMYNLDRMKYRAVKIPLAVFSAFAIGVAVPVYAVVFQMNKSKSS